MIRKGDHKLILRYTPKGDILKRELYHVQKDTYEKKDLSQHYLERTQALEKELLQYLEEVQAEKVTPSLNKKKKKKK